MKGESSKLKGKGGGKVKFGYEDLEVWNRSVNLAVNIIDLIENINTSRKHFRLFEQIEASSTSIAMNLAEGKGRFSKKEFVHFCYISRGSLYETMTLLEIFRRKKWISNSDYLSLESEGKEIVSMIKGLINSLHRSNN